VSDIDQAPGQRYERIGHGYAAVRREDPRFAAAIAAALGDARTVVNVGAGAGFWAHPERVLDPAARAATSAFARMDPAVVELVVDRLRADLESGVWDARHGNLRRLDAYDAGLRLVVSPG
jgi:hypothetical protein